MYYCHLFLKVVILLIVPLLSVSACNKMDHTYTFTSLNDEAALQNENKEIDPISSSGDSLLIDLVRGYPHLYDKSSPNYKDSIMKENSWNEIGKIIICPPTDCQNQWTRLRERFSKERREIETECKSGSGLSHRKAFALYENMKFLQKHVQRRRCYTNITQNEKNKENILNSSNNVPLYESGKQCTITSTPFRNVTSSIKSNSASTSISCQSSKELTASRGIENNMMPTESQNHTILTCAAPEKPATRSSESSISSCDLTHTSPSTSRYDKCFTPIAKKRKSGSDEVEKSILTLSASIAEKLNGPKVEQKTKDIEKDVDDKFGEFIAAELKNIPEQERNEKKKKMINILWM